MYMYGVSFVNNGALGVEMMDTEICHDLVILTADIWSSLTQTLL